MNSTSVVIPLFNKAAHISRALESVLAQTVPSGEILVVDDGSTDGGAEVVQSFADPRIRLIRQENQGVSAARNRGINEAKGELIAFLDADDAWKPRFLEVILDLRRRYPEAGVYATAYEIIAPDGSKIIPEFNVKAEYYDEGLILDYLKVSLDLIYEPALLCSSAITVPQKIMQEVGGFRVGEFLGEDPDTWLRIALRYPVTWIREYLATYHRDAQNRAFGFKRWISEPAISITARQALQSGQIPLHRIQDLREYAARYQLIAARDCLAQGRKDLALKLLHYAQGTNLFIRDWWKWRLMAALPGKTAHYLWKMKQIIKKKDDYVNN